MRSLVMIAGALGLWVAVSSQAAAQTDPFVYDARSKPTPAVSFNFYGHNNAYLSRFNLNVAAVLNHIQLDFDVTGTDLANLLPDFFVNILDSDGGSPGTTVVDTITFTYFNVSFGTYIAHFSGTVVPTGTYFLEAYTTASHVGGLLYTSGSFFIDGSTNASIDPGRWSPTGLVSATDTLIYGLGGQAATQNISPPTGPSGGSTSVPEPISLALFGFGLTGLACVRRRCL